MSEVKHTPEDAKAAWKEANAAYTADKRLRDAAPDMLAALEHARHVILLYAPLYHLERIDTAISKAKGLTPPE